ncbi:hypothetical protein GCM10017786_20070 [Amycolatopsis deserti]|uniref:Uncharacterized protein n=1 Tax=Amycolatopsis deserti TaxID=185696 RepID=A0ABQ3ILQ7_9PSEU|nr:hypothetical protein GCM10017786_20070 [Amycolatopsis deserti]
MILLRIDSCSGVLQSFGHHMSMVNFFQYRLKVGDVKIGEDGLDDCRRFGCSYELGYAKLLHRLTEAPFPTSRVGHSTLFLTAVHFTSCEVCIAVFAMVSSRGNDPEPVSECSPELRLVESFACT